ncbi:DEAD/DEAH box helicase [Methylosinus sp. LW4]|uniref:DEAD/DEAH box helicase n=1 Tax=Methylosinus sp. LW4 TaxID=136993 RepID=UPI00036139D3|nr:DEAD/DEAH box helicase [Methylosinus sp. LW4]
MMLMHRYPVAIDGEARGEFELQYAAAVRKWRMSAAGPDDLPQSLTSRFLGELKPFQTEGVRFLLANGRALLADDMGLGKTVQALAALAGADRWPAVVLCQPHMQTHWERKIGEFLDSRFASGDLLSPGGKISVASLRGAKPDATAPQAHIYIVHYLVVHGWIDLLVARGVAAVVFDECQELRHSGTRKFEANKRLARAAQLVFGLSGTPIYNKGLEIYNVLNVIDRGCLGPKVDFQEQWCSERDPSLVSAPDALGEYLVDRGLVLRRRKQDVLAELPPKRRVIEQIDGDDGTFRALLKEAIGLAQEAEYVTDGFQRAQMEAMAIAKLRRATGVAKIKAACAFLRGLMESGQPTLVFAHHLVVHEAICEALDDFAPARITGEESPSQKDAARQRFIDGDTNLCMIALRSATGIDGLQARARVVVFVELDWSPAVHAQAEDRAYRMGQNDSVLVYYLTVALGSDPFVMMTLSVKERQFLGLMQDAAETEEDRRAAETAAERHKAELLAMLRGGRM